MEILGFPSPYIWDNQIHITQHYSPNLSAIMFQCCHSDLLGRIYAKLIYHFHQERLPSLESMKDTYLRCSIFLLHL
jgi:hypothetical protein